MPASLLRVSGSLQAEEAGGGRRKGYLVTAGQTLRKMVSSDPSNLYKLSACGSTQVFTQIHKTSLKCLLSMQIPRPHSRRRDGACDSAFFF